MTFFEEELKRIMAESAILKDQRYVGRICYGTIGEDLRARIEFVTLGISNQYAGLKASIFNRKEGVVDSVLLRFMDVWGKQKVGNPNFREGVEPHIWADGGKTDWYVFHPSKADYQKLAAGVERYLSVFQDMEMTQSQSYGGQQISP